MGDEAGEIGQTEAAAPDFGAELVEQVLGGVTGCGFSGPFGLRDESGGRVTKGARAASKSKE